MHLKDALVGYSLQEVNGLCLIQGKAKLSFADSISFLIGNHYNTSAVILNLYLLLLILCL